MRLAVSIKNYRAIEALEAELPAGAAGLLACGTNGVGKTSFVKALHAALKARDVEPDAIKIGAGRAEITFDLDDVQIRRLITKKDTYLTVTRNGAKVTRPQTFLDELFGPGIDPLALYLAPPKEQKRLIMAAMPCAIEAEQLKAWAPDLPAGFSFEGHALDVIARAHKAEYEIRTRENAEAKRAREEADRAAAEVLAIPVPSGPVPPLAEVEEALKSAVSRSATLEAQAAVAQQQSVRAERARKKVVELRAQAAREQAEVVIVPGQTLQDEEAKLATATAQVELLARQLKAAEAAIEPLRRSVRDLHEANERGVRHQQRANDICQQADALEASLGEAVEAPSSAEREKAIIEIDRLRELEEAAKREGQALLRGARVKRLKDEAEAKEDVAARRDAVVKFLADEAPKQVLGSGSGIPGLTFDGDDVLLDGVRLSGASGNERMTLAVEIAKRQPGRAKVLILDGLEAIAADKLDEFVNLAAAGGWILFASRVTEGAFSIEAIMLEDEAKAVTT